MLAFAMSVKCNERKLSAMSNLHNTITLMLAEAMDASQRANLEAALGDINKRYGAGKNNLGSSIRKITSNAALAAHGSDNYKKYVNADGSLTPAAHDLNTKFRLDNPHEPAGRGHPIVGGAMYQHENTKHIAKVRAVIQKEQK
jgi:hypothetical protein